MPKYEVYMQRTLFTYFRAHNAVLQEMGVGFTLFSDLKKMAENMQPKYNESRYKFIALTNYDKC